MVTYRMVIAALIIMTVTVPLAQMHAMEMENGARHDGKGYHDDKDKEEDIKETFAEFKASVARYKKALVADRDFAEVSGFEGGCSMHSASKEVSADALVFDDVHVGEGEEDAQAAAEMQKKAELLLRGQEVELFLQEQRELFAIQESEALVKKKELLNKQLLDAAIGSNCKFMRSLIAQGAGVNARFRSGGVTPLMRASYPEIAEILLEAGADVNARTDDGYMALMFAIIGGYKEKAVLLVFAGASFEEIVYSKGDSGDASVQAPDLTRSFCVEGTLMEVLERVQVNALEYQLPIISRIMITSASKLHIGELWERMPQVIKNIVGGYMDMAGTPDRYPYRWCSREWGGYKIDISKPHYRAQWTLEKVLRVQEQIKIREAEAKKAKKCRCVIS